MREDQQAGRRREITNVSVGHMWVPRGLIRSAGPLIYAIVNPVKLCRKYRLMPPLRPADVITVGAPFSIIFVLFLLVSLPLSLSSRYSSSSSRLFRRTCPSFRCIFRASISGGGAPLTTSRSFPFFLERALCAYPRPKFRTTLLSLSLSTYILRPWSRSRANPFTV